MAIEFNPKPADDYKTLLQQFKTLVRLHNANVNCLSLTRGEVAGLLQQLGMMSPGEVDSQRDANAELTTLLEQQEIQLSKAKIMIHNQALEILGLRDELLSTPGPAYRAAADIYYQLVQECEIPEGGSLVGYIDTLREEAGKTVTAFREYGKLMQEAAIDQLEKALDASNQGKSDHETM